MPIFLTIEIPIHFVTCPGVPLIVSPIKCQPLEVIEPILETGKIEVQHVLKYKKFKILTQAIPEIPFNGCWYAWEA